MTTATKTKPETAFRNVLKHAEKIKNDEAHTIATCSRGDMWAQGDVGIVSLEKVPAKAKRLEKPVAQLAPGTTQGSRHCIAAADMKSVTMYELHNATPLDGPVIEAPNGVTVEHPEHGDISLPAGVYGVVYQRAFADGLRRVLD